MAEADVTKDSSMCLGSQNARQCVNVIKVRWHKLAYQKSSIVIMQEKDICSMCYRGKENCYDAEEEHR